MSRKPDYNFRALNKATEERGRLGAAWNNQDGSITVVIDPFVVVPTGKQFLLTLFPYKAERETRVDESEVKKQTGENNG